MALTATTFTRRACIAAACSIALPASAAKDCFLDCTQNCNRVAKGSFKYCEASCGDYCAQDDRQDGLSGSVGTKGGEVGWLSAYNPSRYFGDAQAVPVPYGEDKSPAFEMPKGVRSALRSAVQGGGSSSSSSSSSSTELQQSEL